MKKYYIKELTITFLMLILAILFWGFLGTLLAPLAISNPKLYKTGINILIWTPTIIFVIPFLIFICLLKLDWLQKIEQWFKKNTHKSTFMDNQELEEILDRCNATTPGPWQSWIEGRDGTSASSVILTASQDIYLSDATNQDQDFIAHAKQDIPNLIAEIKRLKKDK